MQLIKGGHKPETPVKQPRETFSGKVLMTPIFQAEDGSCMGNDVCFTPGARTFWHTHERGQILKVFMGSGLICSKGQKPRRIEVGDVIHIPAGETHWHGAAPDTTMGHTAISLGKTSWHEELEQAEYETAHLTAK